VLLATLLLAIVVRRRRMDAYAAGACAAALFLVLAPGFCITYTLIVAPLLLATSVGYGALYALLSSIMAICWYGPEWDLTFPIRTLEPISLKPPASLWGLLAWAALVAFIFRSAIAKSTAPFSEPQNSEL